MKTLLITLIAICGFIGAAQAKYMAVEAMITKEGKSYLVSHRSSDKPISINEFIAYLKDLRNGSMIGLKIISTESVPIPTIQAILTGAAENPLIEILNIQLSFEGKAELERRKKMKAEQDSPEQRATRPESESKGGDKPQPEAEGRSR